MQNFETVYFTVQQKTRGWVNILTTSKLSGKNIEAHVHNSIHVLVLSQMTWVSKSRHSILLPTSKITTRLLL